MSSSSPRAIRRKLALRLADEALQRRFRFEVGNYLDRARRAWPVAAIGACWRNEARRDIEFLPASTMIGSNPNELYHLLRGAGEPEVIPFIRAPLRTVLEDVHNLVRWALVRGHGGAADAFIVQRDAILVIRADRGARRRFGTILPHPDLSAHELLELTSGIEAEFPGRFAIGDQA